MDELDEFLAVRLFSGRESALENALNKKLLNVAIFDEFLKDEDGKRRGKTEEQVRGLLATALYSLWVAAHANWRFHDQDGAKQDPGAIFRENLAKNAEDSRKTRRLLPRRKPDRLTLNFETALRLMGDYYSKWDFEGNRVVPDE